MVSRYASAVLIASGVTFGLFFIMQLLIAMGDGGLSDDEVVRFVDMVQVDRDEEVQREDRKAEKPPEPEIPPDVDVPDNTSLRPDNMNVNVAIAKFGADIKIGRGVGFGGQDGDYLPIVRMEPLYPRRAQERGIEGYTLMEFTVTELGTVENPVVIEEEPKGYFARASLNAVRKWKYKPKVINGQPVRVPGVRTQLTFTMPDD